MQVIKDITELQPLAGGSMGSGGGRKNPPTTPNDRDNSSGDWREPRQWDERSLNPRQVHFRTGHAESKGVVPANNYYEQGRLY
jgi:hypothetical protein